jgi:hypothetical protein
MGRFLLNQLREEFDMTGVPARLLLRGGGNDKNPYAKGYARAKPMNRRKTRTHANDVVQKSTTVPVTTTVNDQIVQRHAPIHKAKTSSSPSSSSSSQGQVSFVSATRNRRHRPNISKSSSSSSPMSHRSRGLIKPATSLKKVKTKRKKTVSSTQNTSKANISMSSGLGRLPSKTIKQEKHKQNHTMEHRNTAMEKGGRVAVSGLTRRTGRKKKEKHAGKKRHPASSRGPTTNVKTAKKHRLVKQSKRTSSRPRNE